MIVEGPSAWRGRRPAPTAWAGVYSWRVIGAACALFWLAVFACAASDLAGHRIAPPAWVMQVLGK